MEGCLSPNSFYSGWGLPERWHAVADDSSWAFEGVVAEGG